MSYVASTKTDATSGATDISVSNPGGDVLVASLVQWTHAMDAGGTPPEVTPPDGLDQAVAGLYFGFVTSPVTFTWVYTFRVYAGSSVDSPLTWGFETAIDECASLIVAGYDRPVGDIIASPVEGRTDGYAGISNSSGDHGHIDQTNSTVEADARTDSEQFWVWTINNLPISGGYYGLDGATLVADGSTNAREHTEGANDLVGGHRFLLMALSDEAGPVSTLTRTGSISGDSFGGVRVLYGFGFAGRFTDKGEVTGSYLGFRAV